MPATDGTNPVSVIVTTRGAGKATLYRFNERHLAAPAIIALADLRAELLSKLSGAIEMWTEPSVYSAMFGSAARGTMKADSDLDLFVVRPDSLDPDDPTWTGQVSELASDAKAWTGNDTRVLEYSEAEVRRGLRVDEAVLADVIRDEIRVTGPARYLSTVKRRRA